MAAKLSRQEALKTFEEEFLKGKYQGPTQGIIVLSGERWTGKTLFGISWPFTPTLLIDLEFSARAYAQPLHSKKNGYGTRWQRLEVKAYSGPEGWGLKSQTIQPGQYKTIVVDPVDKFWEWATLLAKAKVGGSSGEVPASKSGMMWGEAKRLLSKWLMDLSGACDWLFLTSHMHIQWPPPPPPAKPVLLSKTGAVVAELADLMLVLTREKRSNVPPAAEISPLDGKSRFPAMPSRLPIFTPLMLLYYLQADPEAVNFEDPELLPPPVDDGMAALERAVELAERLKAAIANPEEEALPEGSLE